MGRRSFTQILVLLRILFRFSIDFLCGALSISRVRAVGGEAGVSASKTKKFDRIHIVSPPLDSMFIPPPSQHFQRDVYPKSAVALAALETKGAVYSSMRPADATHATPNVAG